MTETNQKALYEHFVKTNQAELAEAILAVYPQFKSSSKEEVKPKEKK